MHILHSRFFLCFCSASNAQQRVTADKITTSWQKYCPAIYVAPAAEATATNYGFAVSFPVIWVKNRIKMTPLLGFFWKYFAADGFDLNPAAGAKILYYLRKQPFGHNFH